MERLSEPNLPHPRRTRSVMSELVHLVNAKCEEEKSSSLD